MNELILIVMLLIVNSTIYLIHHFLDKFGFKIMLILMTIISFIMSFKIGIIFGINTNVNIVTYMSVFTILYILLEKYSQKEIQESIKIIFNTIIYSSIIFICFVLYTQSINDSVILNTNYISIIFPSICSFLVLPLSLKFTVKLYNYLKNINDNIYINIIVCTILIGLIESVICSIISNTLILDINSIIHIALANYLFKVITMIIFLPTIYLINNKKKVLS